MLWPPSLVLLLLLAIIPLAWCDVNCTAPVYSPCYLSSTQTSGTFDAECANVSMPLDHIGLAGGGNIDVFVKRVYNASVPRNLYLVPGGPGEASSSVEFAVPIFRALTVAFNYILIDHRGTGRSARLGCSNSTLDQKGLCPYQAIYKWFSTEQAARDYGCVMTYTPGQNYLWTGSYGTYIGQRIVRNYPSMVKGAIFDSVVSPGDFLENWNVDLQTTFSRYAAGCAADSTCASYMGTSVVESVRAIQNNSASPCYTLVQGLISPESVGPTLRRTINSLLASVSNRVLIFPFLARMRRCSVSDRAELTKAITFFASQAPAPAELGYSKTLQNNIVTSEMFFNRSGFLPSSAQLQAIADAGVLASDSPAEFRTAVDSFTLYTPPAGYTSQPSIDSTDVLVLSGSFDTQTPQANSDRLFSLRVPNKSLNFYEPFSNAAHIAFLTGQMVSPPAAGLTCGMLVTCSWLSASVASNATLFDRSCLNNLAPVDFSGSSTATAALAAAVFNSTVWGTPDLSSSTTSTNSAGVSSASSLSSFLSI